MLQIPGAGFFFCRSGNGHTSAAPQVKGLFAHAVVRAGSGEGLQTVRQRIVIGLLKACMCPVGTAKGIDLSGFFDFIEGLHEFTDRDTFIVAVQQIQVDVLHFHGLQGEVDVFQDAITVCASHPGLQIEVAALGKHGDFVLITAGTDPVTEDRFGSAGAVYTRRVKSVDAVLVSAVQKRERILHAGNGGGAVKQAGNRL